MGGCKSKNAVKGTNNPSSGNNGGKTGAPQAPVTADVVGDASPQGHMTPKQTGVPITPSEARGGYSMSTGAAVDLDQVEGQECEGNLIVRGKVTLENGICYTGQWLGNKKQGYGVQEWPDHARFEGQWKDGFADGEGTFTHADGDCYKGQWVMDKANGYGEYRHSDGSEYKGGWKDDKKHGHAVEVWADGSRFEGQYCMGKKDGKGKFTWPEQSNYFGQFKDNEIHGQGKYTWADGRCYEGQWERNRMNGEGVFTWKDGRKYCGGYVNDKKEGQGLFLWTDGRSYRGGWKNGKQHGEGEFTARSGEKKRGLWQDGVRVRWLEDGETVDVSDDVIRQQTSTEPMASFEARQMSKTKTLETELSQQQPQSFASKPMDVESDQSQTADGTTKDTEQDNIKVAA